MNSVAISDTALRTLDRRLAGSLATPADAAYDGLRQAWNSSARQRPAFVVAAATAGDVAATVRFAAEHGRRVAVQATGHGAAGSFGDDTVLIDLRRLDGVDVDPGRRVARVGGGARWAAVVEAASPHGLAGLAGTSPAVGVTGYVLQGGIGWLSRAHGLAGGSLLAVEYVDAEGEPRRADETTDAEALWAFRGGYGVGIATAVELRLFPHAAFWAGARFWDLEHAPRVLERWLRWTDGLAESVTSIGWAMEMPDAPFMPPPLRGRAVLALGACGTDPVPDRARVEDLVGGLPAPLLDSFRERNWGELGELLAGPPDPMPTRGDGRLLARPDAATLTAALAATEIGRGGPLSVTEMRHLGGQAAASGAEGALTSFLGEFTMSGLGLVPTPEAGAAVDATLGRLAAALAPVDTERSLVAFRGGQTRAPGALDAPARTRLRTILDERDPGRRLRRPRDLTAD